MTDFSIGFLTGFISALLGVHLAYVTYIRPTHRKDMERLREMLNGYKMTTDEDDWDLEGEGEEEEWEM